jgi:hypothetical protein
MNRSHHRSSRQVLAAMLVAAAGDASQAALATTLATGTYTAFLCNGWRLERDDGNGTFAPVTASLASNPAVAFTIYNGATSTVSYEFQTDRGRRPTRAGTLAPPLCPGGARAALLAAPPRRTGRAPNDRRRRRRQAARDSVSLLKKEKDIEKQTWMLRYKGCLREELAALGVRRASLDTVITELLDAAR